MRRPCQHQLHRPLLSDHASESLRSSAAGDDPEGDLGLAELGDSEATIRSHSRASSQPPPSAKPDTAAASGVLQAASRRQNAAAGWRKRLLEGALAQCVDVGAGREHVVGAGDHHDSDLRVGVESLDLGGQLLHQLGREGVAGVGPVQPAEATWSSTLVWTRGSRFDAAVSSR
jgi:hypothetical protein